MVDWEKEAKYWKEEAKDWKEKYERECNQFSSLRNSWNKLIREVDDHEIRMIIARNWISNKNKELSK